jgi:hypothetical protein
MAKSNTLKPQGSWEMRRKLLLPTLAHGKKESLKEILEEMVGVCDFSIDADNKSLVILYDASKTNYETVTASLSDSGFVPLDSWWSRIKGGWYKFTDDNVRDNAKAPPPACCNKPPK